MGSAVTPAGSAHCVGCSCSWVSSQEPQRKRAATAMWQRVGICRAGMSSNDGRPAASAARRTAASLQGHFGSACVGKMVRDKVMCMSGVKRLTDPIQSHKKHINEGWMFPCHAKMTADVAKCHVGHAKCQ